LQRVLVRIRQFIKECIQSVLIDTQTFIVLPGAELSS
jgi:hypothetical protein